MNKQTICIDFDGVIHSYTSPWTDPTVIPDPPTIGVEHALRYLKRKYRICILSARAATGEGSDAIRDWMAHHDLVLVDLITDRKPPAMIYLDDRGLNFDGDWATAIESIENFRVWNK